MKPIFKFLKGQSKKAEGFTLIELMMASMLTLVVVGASGYGLLSMVRENKMASSASETQYNLNRAVDFISSEVKIASSIVTDVSASALTSIAPDFTQASKTPILVLNFQGVTPQPVIYYLAAPSSAWLGPNVIYRWGPNLDSSGSFTNASTPANWSYEALVDLVADSPLSTGCSGTINNTAAATTGWTQIPSSSQKGFYVCVNNVDRRLVEIHASASAVSNLKGIFGPSPTTSSIQDGRYYAQATYEVITQAYARATNNPGLTISGATITPTAPATATVTELAKNTACTTTITRTQNPGSTTYTTGTLTTSNTLTVGVTATGTGCTGTLSVTGVQTGGTVSNLSIFTGNGTINTALTNGGYLSSTVNTIKGLTSSQALLFFYSGSTPVNVILVTLNSP